MHAPVSPGLLPGLSNQELWVDIINRSPSTACGYDSKPSCTDNVFWGDGTAVDPDIFIPINETAFINTYPAFNSQITGVIFNDNAERARYQGAFNVINDVPSASSGSYYALCKCLYN